MWEQVPEGGPAVKSPILPAPSGCFVLGFLVWLGGAVWVAHQPGCAFWDGVIWPYYVGRYVAMHFAALPS